MISMKAKDSLPNMGGWKDRHSRAIHGLVLKQGDATLPLFEQSLVHMLTEWAQYADDHKARYDSLIGDDGVLGDYWRDIGLGLRGLLNGDCGPRLDCGTLDGFILETLRTNGIDTETL